MRSMTSGSRSSALAASRARPAAEASGDEPDGRFAAYLARQRPRSRGTASVAVTDILREAILDGVLPPRAWLRESELAEELGVSRTPIRDAFRTLSSEGLLELSANKGAMVAPITSEDIVELYTIRETLESLVARLAARRVGPGDPERIRTVVQQMHEAVEERRWRDLHDLDLDFHHVIRRMAGNRYIDRSLSQVENAVRRFRDTTYLLPGRAQESLREHEDLGEAIIAGEASRAEQLASAHMRRVAELRMRMLLDGF
jgi:DNA-binding GntR family transcriptional regulator